MNECNVCMHAYVCMRVCMYVVCMYARDSECGNYDVCMNVCRYVCVVIASAWAAWWMGASWS